ncbi:hypothetical protein PROFUN_02164 [Planoprotostelium fungivorum]|uniref:Uncharacterized protein n=1 Tax=Planoprotostelium fungivorum TaxID=1890364 RepID=A0A2P6NZB4_9EUKA|nr:hypothetical protein PROFUN_02164 [Planoprotostelium fungivorum]
MFSEEFNVLWCLKARIAGTNRGHTMDTTIRPRKNSFGLIDNHASPSDYLHPPCERAEVLSRMSAAARGVGTRGQFYSSIEDPFNQPLSGTFYTVRLSSGQRLSEPSL